MAYPYYPNYSAWGNYTNPLMGTPPQMQTQPQPQQAQTAPLSDINWVQGEADAKARPVLAGHSAIFMDSEESVMYIKTVDQSGIPQPLRVFEYKERTTEQQNSGAKAVVSEETVTRSEFNALAEKVNRLIEGEGEG